MESPDEVPDETLIVDSLPTIEERPYSPDSMIRDLP